MKRFKEWFSLMWDNFYIQIFIIALAIIYCIVKFLSDQLWVLFLPILMILIVSYKGFYQFWDDWKKGISR